MARTVRATDVADAAARRAAAAKDPKPMDERTKQLLDALAEERRGYVARGMTERVAQVDEQIALISE